MPEFFWIWRGDDGRLHTHGKPEGSPTFDLCAIWLHACADECGASDLTAVTDRAA